MASVHEDGRQLKAGEFEDLWKLRLLFKRYMEGYLYLSYVMLYKGFEYLLVPMVNRFTDLYRRRTIVKLNQLRGVKFDLHMTLTLNPEGFQNLLEQYLWINKAWNKLNTYLRYKYPRFAREGCYIKVLEATRVGRPHLHVLIKGIRYLKSDDVTEKWKEYGGGICKVRSARFNAYNYVLKYVTKSVSGGDVHYSALLFASNCRVYSMSRSLSLILKVERSDEYSKWTFAWIVEVEDVDKWMMLNDVPWCTSFKANIDDFDAYLYG